MNQNTSHIDTQIDQLIDNLTTDQMYAYLELHNIDIGSIKQKAYEALIKKLTPKVIERQMADTLTNMDEILIAASKARAAKLANKNKSRLNQIFTDADLD